MTGTNPLVVSPTDTSSALSGTLLLESVADLVAAIDSGSWVDTALAGFGVAMDTAAAVMDPIGQLLAAGLGWLMEHLEPLKGWLNDLTGDAGAVAAFAATWDNIATQLLTAAENHTRLVATDLAAMSGDAIDAYTRHATELTDTLRSIGGAAGAVSGSLHTASTIVQLVHDIVRDALAEIVGAAISWAFTVTVTVGLGTPWVVGQVATRVSSLATRVGSKVMSLLESLRKLGDLIIPLRRAFETITDALRRATAGGLRQTADTIDPQVRSDGVRGRSRARRQEDDGGGPGRRDGAGADEPSASDSPSTSDPEPQEAQGATPTPPARGESGGTTAHPGPSGTDVPAADLAPTRSPLPDISDLDDIHPREGNPVEPWAEQVAARHPDLTSDEVAAVYRYTTDEGYDEMNGFLRDPSSFSPADVTRIETDIDNATNAISQLSVYDGTTYRGTNVPDDVLEQWMRDGVVQDPAFWSTTTSRDVAHQFRGSGNAFFTIEGGGGTDVRALSHYGNEAEILVPPGTRYDVVDSVWDPGGFLRIVLREQP